MKSLFPILALMTSLSLANGQSYIANLDGDQDGGGTRQGSGTVNLTLSGTTLSLSGSFTGLSANASAAHIHGPAAAGINAGVIYNLGAPGIIPTGATSGAISGAVTLATQGAYTLAQQLTDLGNGLWYVNIHDATFGGGEIRGQITPVPEPSTFAIAGLSLVGLLALRARRTA